MAEVIRIEDATTLVPTSKYQYAHWPFEEFNPVQSRLFDVFEGGSNVAIAAATSAGKTVCSEMYLAYEIRKRGGKGIYVGPLKALAKEKEMDWQDPKHHFNDVPLSIITGDYRFTTQRISELDEAKLIVMTPEMLASRCRNNSSDKSRFLQDVGTVVFDESHLLTVPGRGDHIEVALMKLTRINPDVRIVLLSATMPNVDEICGWCSDLTKRDTYFLESDYRPCPLAIHYEHYYDGDRTYDDKELQKAGTACSIVDYYKDDKFLVFVHTKRTGQLMVDALARQGVKAEFHNADLDLKARLSLEERFKNDKSFRVLVATSTLAWGLNLPARRVIVTGVHRGLQVVENYDIQQMIGRAGRPKYDPKGDAYILVPESEKKEWIQRLQKKAPIRSTLLEYVGKEDNPHYKTLAFHIVSEIHHGEVKTKEGFHEWFRKTLAHYQEHAFDDTVVDKTISLLEQCRAIAINDGEYECTPVGKIASMFYYSPFDVSDLRRNFKNMFEENKEGSDFAISIALGNIDSHRWNICNRQEKEAIGMYKKQVEKLYGENRFGDPVMKAGCAYFNLLHGKWDVPALAALQSTISADMERTMQVLNSIDNMSCRWDRQQWFKTLQLRLRYGVEPDLVELCQIANVGQARAKRLKAMKIKTVGDFTTKDASSLATIMKCSLKLAQEALESAKLIELKGSL